MNAERADGLPFDRYCALTGEHATGLISMLVSPLAYRHRRDHERPDADELRVGRASHTAILEPHRFRAEYVVWQGGRRYGGEWNAFRVEHQGRTILTQAQHETALAISAAVRAHPIAAALLADPDNAPEVTFTWTHARTGLRCKARIDLLAPATIVEIKTTRDPTPQLFSGQVARLLYHVQCAFYRTAFAAMYGQHAAVVPVKLIAAASSPPHDVVVYDLPDDVLQLGEAKAEQALDLVAACTASGSWPGVAAAGEVELRLPRWAMPDDLDGLELDGKPLFEEVSP